MNSIQELSSRIGAISNGDLATDLNAFGCATLKGILSPEQYGEISRLYPEDKPFRSHIHMARHGFGKGEYKYFSYPLPEPVSTIREQLYPKLVPVANEWNERMGLEPRFPLSHSDYIDKCHTAGQTRPTPLLLQYAVNDFNCLRQDVYGDLLFPLQVAVLLSRSEHDFTGGEYVLTEQRPRMQSRTEVVSLDQGDAVVFAVRNRPVKGAKRDYRVNVRHGVSRLKGGQRHTLGVIFHDAK
ncbi:2OG-Fe(II) oxygenase [Sulfitobacter sp.]|uniref:2OG-Fe(II) oxygenase n=1 Tax=Sulfitobacter sp. TaxID=1903071 RepID=UPI0030019C7D